MIRLARACIFALVAGLGCAPAAAPPLQVVEVSAGDFYFQAPDTVASGRTEFRMRNMGGRHVMVVSRIDSGHTFGEALAVADTQPLPGWIHDLGGPITADSASVTSTIMDLLPGRYALVCYFSDVNGRPHFASGMVRELTVKGPPAQRGLPLNADVVVTLTDFDFEITRPIPAGPTSIRFVNSSRQSHEVIIVRLRTGTHLADWLRARAAGTPLPVTPAGGIGSLAPNTEVVMAANFVPGDYLWICFFEDVGDGRSHLDHGMIREIHID